MNSFTWIEAADVAGAIAAGAQQGALFKAGGVDVTDLMKERVAQPTALVNLRRIGELEFLREEKGALVIGPLVTLARLAEDPLVVKGANALALAAGWAGTPQIRNLATLGGNLAQRPRCPYFRSGSAISPRSAATSRSDRAAPTSAASCSTAARKAAASASRSPARTRTTRCSTTTCAPSCIPAVRRPRWSRLGLR